jgi:hypothetical protein
MRALFVCCALLVLIPARPARAETAAVLTPFTEDGVTADLGQRCLQLAATWLGERGIEVVLPADAANRLPPDIRYCRKDDCALSYMQHLRDVDYAVLISIWGHPRGTGATGVSLTFLTRDGQRYDESWAITESLALSVDAALTHAYTNFLRGPGPWLTVRGRPQGARVIVDGARVGEIPYHARISAGTHQIVVQSEGFESQAIDISVADDVDTHRELDVGLRKQATASAALPAVGGSDTVTVPAQAGEGQDRIPDSDGTDLIAVDDGASKPSSWNYILGGTLLAASVPLVLFPTVTAVNDGECRQPDSAGDCESHDFDGQSAGLLAAGVVTLVGGAFMIIAAPIPGESNLSAEARLHGIRLSGSF